MGSRIARLPGGLLVPGRCTLATLEPRDGTATGSSYTESVSRPGIGIAGDGKNKSRIEISNGQGEDLSFRCIRAGMPGRDGGSFAYRLGTESGAGDWRGWSPPVWLDAWRAVDWDTTIKYNKADICVIPTTQTAVIVRAQSDTQVAASRTVSPSLAIGAVSSTPMPFGLSWNSPAVCVIPSLERLLCVFGGTVYYSDDVGDTWAVYSSSPFGSSITTHGRSRMAYHQGQILLLVEDDTTAGKVYQYASSDLGTTFALVETLLLWGDQCSILVTPSGMQVVYRQYSTNEVYAVRLASPFEPLSRADSEQVQIGSRIGTGYSGLVAWADPDGVLWAYLHTGGTELYTHTSLTDGQSWAECQGMAYISGAAFDEIVPIACASAAGRALLIHSSDAFAGTYDDSLGLLAYGGHSNVTTGKPVGSPGTGTGYTQRLGTAGYRASFLADAPGMLWLPIEPPTTSGWTLVGTAGTLTSSGSLEISTSAADGLYLRNIGTGSVVIQTEMRVVSGGALGSPDIYLQAEVADGTDDYEVRLSFTTTGFRVRDLNDPSDVVDVTLDMTEYRQILLQVTSAGRVSVWTRTPGSTSWAQRVAAVQLVSDTASPGFNGNIRFGHVTSTAVSEWRYFGHSYFNLNSEPGVYYGGADVYGRSGAPLGAPIPDAIDASGRAPYVAVVDGPARMGDLVEVAVEHDYPIEAIFPETAPSPATQWRSTDTTEQIIAWDLGARSWVGDAIGLYITGANFRTAHLEYYDGATWQLAGTLDMAQGFSSGLTYDLVGDTVVPRSGTGAGGRFLAHQELVGGHVILATADVREIAAQSAGSWTSTSTVQPRIRILGLDGTEAANGSAVIVAPRGLLTVYHSSVTIWRRWRVRIPAQTTPDGHFRAGAIVVGRVQPWGARIDWSRSDDWTPNVEVSRNAYGTTRVKQSGPIARTWGVAWNDAVHGRYLRGSPDIDWHGVSGGLPLTAQDDVGYLLAGILHETRGGEVPVVVVEELPTSGGTLTDVSRMLYGRILSSARLNAVQGDLGVDEIYRVEGITITELV